MYLDKSKKKKKPPKKLKTQTAVFSSIDDVKMVF